jgi:antitoxin component YwqK of YwqJK toxin-antitoxin module
VYSRRIHIIAALILSCFSISGQESFLSYATALSTNSNSTPANLVANDPSFISETIPGHPDNNHTNKAAVQLTSGDSPLLKVLNLNDTCGPDSTVTEKAEFPGKFKIGEYILMDDQDNLTVYFNCLGRIMKKECAQFYRKGKMDSTYLSLAGNVKDYYLNDTLALEGYLENSLLNGPAIYYHENGKIRSKGNYRNNKRTGVWTYFYNNGSPEKIINYVRDFPFIVAYYARSGKQHVVQGNGKYKGKFMMHKSCSPMKISGRVIEGKMHGKWKVHSEFYNQKVATEYYHNGKFIKRKSGGETYTDQPLISINGYTPNEYLLWTENITGCPDENFQVLIYMGEDPHGQFYPALIDSLCTLPSETVRDQWLIAGIHIANNSLVHSVSVKSSIDDKDTVEKIYRILQSMMHFSVIHENGITTDTDYFFTILFRDDTVIIPADLYYKEVLKSLPKLQ